VSKVLELYRKGRTEVGDSDVRAYSETFGTKKWDGGHGQERRIIERGMEKKNRR